MRGVLAAFFDVVSDAQQPNLAHVLHRKADTLASAFDGVGVREHHRLFGRDEAVDQAQAEDEHQRDRGVTEEFV